LKKKCISSAPSFVYKSKTIFNKEENYMFGYEFFYGYWWIFPLIMIIFCIFFMRRGCGRMMCGFGSHNGDIPQNGTGESGLEILAKRFAQGDISKDEYEEKKRKLTNR